MSALVESCPGCASDLRGEPIPQDYIARGYYPAGATHYLRIIGHEIPGIYDGTLFYACPDCGHAWPRVFGDPHLDALSVKFATEHSAERFIA